MLVAPLAHAQSTYTTPYFFTTLAGVGGASGSANGTGSAARFLQPYGLTVDTAGVVYVADSRNNTIRKITPFGVVTTIAGLAGTSGSANGTGNAARFDYPVGVAVDKNGNLFVTDNFSHLVRKITPDGTVTTFAGAAGINGAANGTGAAARFNGPWGIAVDTAGNLYVSDADGHAIRKITPDAVVTTLAGVPGVPGTTDGLGTVAQFNGPGGLAVDSTGNVYVSDDSNHRIRKITPAGIVSTLAGPTGAPVTGDADGPASSARFNLPRGIALDGAGNLYVTDIKNAIIRKISAAGVVSTLAGLSGTIGSADGLGSAVRFNSPQGIAVDARGNLYVADTLNHTVRMSVFPPDIAPQPISQVVSPGASATFTSGATSNVPITYQWQKDGAAISGATTTTLTLSNIQTANLGNYTLVATNMAGSITSNPAVLAFIVSNAGRLTNLSIRTNAGTGAQTLIVGVVIGGANTTGTKPLLIRGVGPTLGVFGVAGALADPMLSVFSDTTVVASNDNWAGDPQVTAIGTQVGAFAYGSVTSKDAALYSPALNAGAYTVQIAGVGGTTGITLAEIYDATPLASFFPATARLINVSARTQVGTGADILITGFTIGGTTSKTLLIRAVGPTLGVFGVAGVLADPKLDLFSGTTVIQSNDNWGGGAAITAAAASVGAFALDGASKDAVLLVTLPPGSYTAQVSGVGNTTGVALVEIYDVP